MYKFKFFYNHFGKMGVPIIIKLTFSKMIASKKNTVYNFKYSDKY